MSLDKKLEALKFDVRLQDWNLRNGVVKEADLKQHLQNLEDVSGNAGKLELEDEQSGNSSAH